MVPGRSTFLENHMFRGIAAVSFLALGLAVGVTGAFAQGDVISQRKALMKAIGDANRAPAAMLRGEQPFALAPVQAALKAMEEAGAKSPPLYPESSKKGDTRALPKVWETKADFNAKLAKFEADAKAAQVSIVDEASFKSTFPAVLKNCSACHQDYRERR